MKLWLLTHVDDYGHCDDNEVVGIFTSPAEARRLTQPWLWNGDKPGKNTELKEIEVGQPLQAHFRADYKSPV